MIVAAILVGLALGALLILIGGALIVDGAAEIDHRHREHEER